MTHSCPEQEGQWCGLVNGAATVEVASDEYTAYVKDATWADGTGPSRTGLTIDGDSLDLSNAHNPNKIKVKSPSHPIFDECVPTDSPTVVSHQS